MQTARSYNGMVVTPHGLATQAAVNILQQGGNAVEAAVTAASTLSVVYPHMTGIGGDGFWLVMPAGGQEPVYIDACGCSGHKVNLGLYHTLGLAAVPKRGAFAAITVAGAVSGWEQALEIAASFEVKGRLAPLGLDTLLQPAIQYAENGFPVAGSQASMTAMYEEELAAQPGFASQYLIGGKAPVQGQRMCLPVIANTFKRLCKDGLASFYQGAIAADIAKDMEEAGGVLDADDLGQHKATVGKPLSLAFAGGRVFNSSPPTQGMASLIILGVLERLAKQYPSILQQEGAFAHAIVEATKLAFALRDKWIADPRYVPITMDSLLTDSALDDLAKQFNEQKAVCWPQPMAAGGDTVWLGVMDRWGNSVSYIQSIYHEFGSGVVLPRTGIVWQNRGLGFSMVPDLPNSLAPSKKPFHTLNPAMAVMPDGRLVSYGTMGGEGQPQTQAAIFGRVILRQWEVQQAIAAPRWLLGRAWGDTSNNLKVEADFPADGLLFLKNRGHDMAELPIFSSLVGHAGMLVRHRDGLLEGGFDPRSDGSAGYW